MRCSAIFRFPRVLLALWAVFCLLPLAWPQTRHTLGVQLFGRSPFYAGWSHIPLFSGGDALWKPRPDLIAERFPGDPEMQAEAVVTRAARVIFEPSERGPAANPDTAARRACLELDALMRQFPDAAWLPALRLRWTLLWMRHDRLGGELADLNYQANKARGVPSPESNGSQPNFSQAEIAAALRAAEHGARLEPDNAYFDWMRAQLLLFARRDAQAWQACRRGAAKARFETHEREWLRAEMHVRERELGRALLPEEANAVRLSQSGLLLNGRGLARIVAWEAIKKTRRGDAEGALQIYNSFGTLLVRRAQGAYSDGEARQAQGLLMLALLRARPGENLPSAATYGEIERREFAAFRDWARRHAKTPATRRQAEVLAAQAMALSRRAEALDALKMRNRFYNGMATTPWERSILSFCVATLFLQQALLAGAMWLLLWGALRFVLPPGQGLERSDRTAGVILLGSVLFLLMAGAAMESLRQGTAQLNLPLRAELVQRGDGEVAALLFPWSAIAPVLFASILAQGLTLWRGNEKTAPKTDNALRSVVPFVVLFTLSLFTGAMLLWWQSTLSNPLAQATVPRRLAGLNLLGGGYTVQWTALHPLWPLGGAVIGLILGWTRWVLAAAPRRRALMLYRLQWLHHLLGAAVILCSLCYVALSFWALPARRAAHEESEKCLALGDNALWQQRLAQER